MFHQHWQIYRTMVEENYLFHREAYACLHHILVEETVKPLHFPVARGRRPVVQGEATTRRR